MDTRENATKLE